MAARDMGQGSERTPYLCLRSAELHIHLLGAHAFARTDRDGVQTTPYDSSECALGFVVWVRVDPGKASWWGESIFPYQRTCTAHCLWRNLDPSGIYRLSCCSFHCHTRLPDLKSSVRSLRGSRAGLSVCHSAVAWTVIELTAGFTFDIIAPAVTRKSLKLTASFVPHATLWLVARLLFTAVIVGVLELMGLKVRYRTRSMEKPRRNERM
jgi:hypothetical protein